MHGEFGEAEHEDFGAGIVETDCGLGVNARALYRLNHATTETLVKDYLSYGNG